MDLDESMQEVGAADLERTVRSAKPRKRRSRFHSTLMYLTGTALALGLYFATPSTASAQGPTTPQESAQECGDNCHPYAPVFQRAGKLTHLYLSPTQGTGTIVGQASPTTSLYTLLKDPDCDIICATPNATGAVTYDLAKSPIEFKLSEPNTTQKALGFEVKFIGANARFWDDGKLELGEYQRAVQDGTWKENAPLYAALVRRDDATAPDCGFVAESYELCFEFDEVTVPVSPPAELEHFPGPEPVAPPPPAPEPPPEPVAPLPPALPDPAPPPVATPPPPPTTTTAHEPLTNWELSLATVQVPNVAWYRPSHGGDGGFIAGLGDDWVGSGVQLDYLKLSPRQKRNLGFLAVNNMETDGVTIRFEDGYRIVIPAQTADVFSLYGGKTQMISDSHFAWGVDGSFTHTSKDPIEARFNTEHDTYNTFSARLCFDGVTGAFNDFHAGLGGCVDGTFVDYGGSVQNRNVGVGGRFYIGDHFYDLGGDHKGFWELSGGLRVPTSDAGDFSSQSLHLQLDAGFNAYEKLTVGCGVTYALNEINQNNVFPGLSGHLPDDVDELKLRCGLGWQFGGGTTTTSTSTTTYDSPSTYKLNSTSSDPAQVWPRHHTNLSCNTDAYICTLTSSGPGVENPFVHTQFLAREEEISPYKVTCVDRGSRGWTFLESGQAVGDDDDYFRVQLTREGSVCGQGYEGKHRFELCPPAMLTKVVELCDDAITAAPR